MSKTITVHIEPWCPNDCGYFHLGENKLYGDDKLLDTYYYCENLPICRNAVNAGRCFDKNRDEVARTLFGYCNEPKKEDD